MYSPFIRNDDYSRMPVGEGVHTLPLDERSSSAAGDSKTYLLLKNTEARLEPLIFLRADLKVGPYNVKTLRMVTSIAKTLAVASVFVFCTEVLA